MTDTPLFEEVAAGDVDHVLRLLATRPPSVEEITARLEGGEE